MFIIKHKDNGQYVMGDILLGNKWGFTYTMNKEDAKKFNTSGEARDLIKRFNDPDYITEEV
jgi:hypothetical protein